MIWQEGAVVVPAPLMAEYIKVFEKICNRQKQCKYEDVGRSIESMKKLAMKAGESDNVKQPTKEK